MEQYADLLRSCYRDHQLFPPDQWPPALNEVFVNLALVQHDKLPTEDSLSAFEKATLNGTVDDLCFRKYNIKPDQIFKPDTFFFKKSDDLKEKGKVYEQQLIRLLNYPMPDFLKKKFNIPLDDGKGLPSEQELKGVMKQSGFQSVPQLRQLLVSSHTSQESGASSTSSESDPHDLTSLKVLIDGAPGVGKTTLTWQISQEWAQGKLFQQLTLVIQITLRNLPDDPKEFWELLPLGSEHLRRSVEKELLDRNGQGTLLILDGWDELSVEQRKKGSVLYGLVRGDILPQCAVIITSRPYTSRWLQLPRMVPRHIELFGFTQEQIKSCIRNELASSPESAQQLIRLLEVRVDVFKLCYIPMNLSTIVYIFRTSNYSLPATLTKLYELYVHSAKVNYLQSHCEDPEAPLSYDEQSSFPPDVHKLYVSLCALALWGLDQERPKMVFKDRELGDFSPSLVQKGKTLGLMTAYKNFSPYGVQRSFQFIHATIQDFLAAEALSRRPLDQQFGFIYEHWNNPQFQMMLSFLAGKTGLAAIEGLYHFPLSFKGHSNVSRFLLLVRMLYEAQNGQLCRALAQNFPENSFRLSSLLSIDMTKISELDFYMLCYFLRHSAHAWKALDAYAAPLSQILDVFKASPPGLSVEEIHIDSSSSDDVYKSLNDPCFESLKALRVEVETPLGEHASHFLSCYTLTHLQFDCYNQGSLEAAMSAASKCRALQYLGLKTQRSSAEHRDDRQKKLLLSELVELPTAMNSDFCFSFKYFELSDHFTELLCHCMATSQHFKQLHFKGCVISSHQLNLLFTEIRRASTLQVFHLQQVPSLQWSSQAAHALKEMVASNTAITSLQLSLCSLDGDLAADLGQALESNRCLASCDLSNNKLVSSVGYVMRGFEISATLALKESIKPSLHTLILNGCGLRDEEMNPIAHFLSSTCCTIKELDLSYNSIKQKGSDDLFAAIATNCSLLVLKLDGNPLLLSNGDQMRDMLTHNTTLLELHLLCHLHVPSIQELANGIAGNSTLKTLKLGVRLPLNLTPVEGACMLFRALKVNTSLEHLLLSAYMLGSQGTEAAAEALAHNTTLVSLHFKGCKFGSSESNQALITALYSHKRLSEIMVPATRGIFSEIFSQYDRINCYRAANKLPYLQIIDALSSKKMNKSLLLP